MYLGKRAFLGALFTHERSALLPRQEQFSFPTFHERRVLEISSQPGTVPTALSDALSNQSNSFAYTLSFGGTTIELLE